MPVSAATQNGQPKSAIMRRKGTLAMKSRQGYKGYVIEARSCELKRGEFSAEFSVEEHDASGVTETQFYLPNTFSKQESAIEALESRFMVFLSPTRKQVAHYCSNF